MDTAALKTNVDLASKIGAAGVVVLYVAGFLVVMIHNATYGIVEFSLFRARILAAGILVAIFIALPFIEAFRAHGMFGFQPRFEFAKPAGADELTAGQGYWLWVAQGSAFTFLSWILSWFLWLAVGEHDRFGRFTGVWLGYLAIYLAAWLFIGKGNFWRHPLLYANIFVLIGVTGCLAMLAIRQWYFVGLVGWCLAVCFSEWTPRSP